MAGPDPVLAARAKALAFEARVLGWVEACCRPPLDPADARTPLQAFEDCVAFMREGRFAIPPAVVAEVRRRLAGAARTEG